MWADIVVFDQNRILDTATYDSPYQYPQGISYVLVNGRLVIEQANHTGALPGKILRKGS
jgi:N-acyl-D-amino-acid deacylase